MKLTPKEKTKELVKRFLGIKKINPESITRPYNYQEAKQGALICVDEMQNVLMKGEDCSFENASKVMYLQEVKEEVNKL